jgi:hypothetical protein
MCFTRHDLSITANAPNSQHAAAVHRAVVRKGLRRGYPGSVTC